MTNIRPKKTLLNRITQKHVFSMVVVLPTVIVAFYYLFICTPRYISESTFSIRSAQGGGVDLLASLTGIPSNNSGSVAEDNYAIKELLHSHAIINKLPKELKLKQLYGKDRIDFMSRFTSGTMREQKQHWKKNIHIKVDALSNLSKLSTEAYSPEEALALNTYLLNQSENFINQLSARLQEDAIKQAREELKHSEERLFTANQNLNLFLNDKGEIDPAKSASARGEIIAQLETKLATKRTEMSAQQAYLKGNAPVLSALYGEISALQKQITLQKRLLEGSSTKTTELLSEYKNFLLEKEFAEKAYASSLANIEKARIDASTQKRYLVRIIEPNLPDETGAPHALRKILNTLLFTFLLWGILSLLIATVRDHIGVI